MISVVEALIDLCTAIVASCTQLPLACFHKLLEHSVVKFSEPQAKECTG